MLGNVLSMDMETRLLLLLSELMDTLVVLTNFTRNILDVRLKKCR